MSWLEKFSDSNWWVFPLHLDVFVSCLACQAISPLIAHGRVVECPKYRTYQRSLVSQFERFEIKFLQSPLGRMDSNFMWTQCFLLDRQSYLQYLLRKGYRMNQLFNSTTTNQCWALQGSWNTEQICCEEKFEHDTIAAAPREPQSIMFPTFCATYNTINYLSKSTFRRTIWCFILPECNHPRQLAVVNQTQAFLCQNILGKLPGLNIHYA